MEQKIIGSKRSGPKWSALVLPVVLALAGGVVAAPDAGFQVGAAKLESAGPLAFGPDGVLFVADTLAASIWAIDTKDTKSAGLKDVRVDKLGEKLAALLATESKSVRVTDLAVNPVSGRPYLALVRTGKPVIARVENGGGLGVVSLDNVRHARVELPNAPGRDAKDRRGRPQRLESITDLAFVDNRILVAGLSTEEFASTLRSIPYPFQITSRVDSSIYKGTGVEVYHGAHGQLETRSPVRTFVPFNFDGSPQLLAAYTCTPLVRFPLSDLKPGAQVRGTTIAELGNRNQPLDMITYEKGGKVFLLMANSKRGLMKIPTDEVMTAKHIDSRVRGGGKAGIGYETVSDKNDIEQLDRFDEKRAIIVRKSEGGLRLETMPLP